MNLIPLIGEEIRRVATKSSQGEPKQGGRREVEEGLRGSRSCGCPRVDFGDLLICYTLTLLINTAAIPPEPQRAHTRGCINRFTLETNLFHCPVVEGLNIREVHQE